MRENSRSNVAERLCRIGVAAVDGEAEKITGQRKSDNLPAAVQQRLVKAHDTVGHDIDKFGRFILIDERRLVLVVDIMCEFAQHDEFCAVQRAADAELLHRAVRTGAFARSAGRARHDAGEGGSSGGASRGTPARCSSAAERRVSCGPRAPDIATSFSDFSRGHTSRPAGVENQEDRVGESTYPVRSGGGAFPAAEAEKGRMAKIVPHGFSGTPPIVSIAAKARRADKCRSQGVTSAMWQSSTSASSGACASDARHFLRICVCGTRFLTHWRSLRAHPSWRDPQHAGEEARHIGLADAFQISDERHGIAAALTRP